MLERGFCISKSGRQLPSAFIVGLFCLVQGFGLVDYLGFQVVGELLIPGKA